MSNATWVAGNEGWPLGIELSMFTVLLFDLDGTLADTMHLHYEAYAAVFAARGFLLREQDYLTNIGPPARIAIPAFGTAIGMTAIDSDLADQIHQEKKHALRDLLKLRKALPLPAAGMLQRYYERKRMALVSSANRDGIEMILTTLGWQLYFDCVISGDDVVNGKPHPEPYILAAMRMGAAVEQCIVFEDAEAGIISGLAAGMTVVDVTRPGVIHEPHRSR